MSDSVFNPNWRIMIYLGIVSVGHQLDLWCKPNCVEREAVICHKYYLLRSAVVPTTETNRLQDVYVHVQSFIVSDMISCDGWPDFHQERNAMNWHCMNTITHWDAWQLSLGSCRHCMMRPWYPYDERWRHSVELWAYKPSEMTIRRSHYSGNEKNKLRPEYAVNSQIHRRRS